MKRYIVDEKGNRKKEELRDVDYKVGNRITKKHLVDMIIKVYPQMSDEVFYEYSLKELIELCNQIKILDESKKQTRILQEILKEEDE